MSTQSKPLGSRENWFGEQDLDELRDTPVSELSARDLRRLIEHDTDHNVKTDHMGERELKAYVQRLRDLGHDTQPSVTAYEIAQWKAHQILRQVADKYSKTAKHGSPDRGWPAAYAFVFEHYDGVDRIRDHDPNAIHTERCTVELTEPTLHIPKANGRIEYGQFRLRKRFDPEHGYIGGVGLDDLGIGRFLEVAEIVLGNVKEEHSFRQQRIDEWFALAKRLKQEPDMSDQDVLTEVLTEIYIRVNRR